MGLLIVRRDALCVGEQDEWLLGLLDWTEANLTRRITLQDATELTHFAKGYFCNRFKKLTGVSYIQYVNLLRLERSRRLLADGGTVETAAQSCGIACVPYFVQLFKRHYGVTPARYRLSMDMERGKNLNDAAAGG